MNIVTGEVENLTTRAVLRAEPWEEGTPPYEILMAGGLEEYMKVKITERGLIST